MATSGRKGAKDVKDKILVKPDPDRARTPHQPAPRQSRKTPVTPRSAMTHRPAPPSASSVSGLSPSVNRGRRSGAPTVDTHAAHNDTIAVVDEEDGDDDVLFMETRRHVKSEPQVENNGVHVNALDDSDKNLKSIGKHLKKFNDTLSSLQQMGVQHDVNNLPELVLVGDQSSGKSSLMSAISQIILPRSDGVCTRCPIHIHLSSATTWRCRITLQQDYVYRPLHDEPITEAEVTAQNPFPPWVKQPRETNEFKLILDKSDPIDEVVRWAQIAILNHNQNYTYFIPKDWDKRTDEEREPGYEAARLASAESRTDAKFSPNSVAIKVNGPGLPDLSFYDMPGVFRNARHEEDQFLVKVVENLAKEYIARKNAIILWAVPMNHDPETSSTFTLIRALRAQNRTIGVLTKADLLPKGGHQQWLAMLAGKQHQVGKGYFITSRAAPDLEDQDTQRRDRQSLREEHAAEEAFFNRQSEDRAWPQEFSQFDDRCGIDQLVKFLAQTLAQEFARNLPDVQDKLNNKLAVVRDQLGRLPEMPDNPELEVRRSLMQFTTDVKARLTSKGFVTAWGQIADDFRRIILELKPKYKVMPEGFLMQHPEQGQSHHISDMESVLSGGNNSPSLSTKRGRPIDLTNDLAQPSPQRRRGMNGSAIKNEDGNGSFNTPSRAQHKTAHGLLIPARIPGTSLAELRRLINSEREAGKPGQVPYDLIERLSIEAVRPWQGPLEDFLRASIKFLQREMDAALDKCFATLKKRQVYRSSHKLCEEFLSQHRARVREYLLRNLKIEGHKVCTMDEPLWKMHQVKEDHLLRRNRHFFRWKQFNNDTSHEQPEDWNKMTAEAQRKEDERMQKERSRLGTDPYNDEMSVAAYVRGYYLTSATRFIDNTVMHISSGLFPDLVEDIDFYLDGKLGLVNKNEGSNQSVFETLMEEEPKTARQRVALKAELKKFDKAVAEIRDLRKTVESASAPPEDGRTMEEMVDGDFDDATMMGEVEV